MLVYDLKQWADNKTKELTGDRPRNPYRGVASLPLESPSDLLALAMACKDNGDMASALGFIAMLIAVRHAPPADFPKTIGVQLPTFPSAASFNLHQRYPPDYVAPFELYREMVREGVGEYFDEIRTA